MELRGQEKGTRMPNSSSHNPTCGERRRDNQAHGPQRDPDLYHCHQLNLQPQTRKPIKDPDLIPDPPPATAPAPAPTPTETVATSAATNAAPAPCRSISRLPLAISTTTTTSTSLVRYRECLKNHAANMGGHVVDGCGEFMPRGEEGSLEALICAACECHRNFHRKEIDGKLQYLANSHCKNNSQRNTLPPPPPPSLPQLATSLPPPQAPYHQHHRYPYGGSSAYSAPIAPTIMTFGGGGGAGAATESSSEDLNTFNSNLQGQVSVQQPSSKKRFRTKFSQEQKEEMMEFADKIGWKIQKQDEKEVQQFCSQVGVKRKVFKVWMHNTKQARRNKCKGIN